MRSTAFTSAAGSVTSAPSARTAPATSSSGERTLARSAARLPISGAARIAARVGHGPAREAARHLGDVPLRVAPVHAQRVQLEQLAGVVLVEAERVVAPGTRAGRPGRGAACRPGAAGAPVVEVDEHRR